MYPRTLTSMMGDYRLVASLKKGYDLEDSVLAAIDIAFVLFAVAVSIVAAESLVAGEAPMPSSCPPFAINASAEISSTAIAPAVAALPAPAVFC